MTSEYHQFHLNNSFRTAVRSISLPYNNEQRVALISRRVYRTGITAAEKHKLAIPWRRFARNIAKWSRP